jgi:peroxiredoxin
LPGAGCRINISNIKPKQGGGAMKRIFMKLLAAGAILVMVFNARPIGANSTPKKGGTLPAIKLKVPEDPVHRSYLGLSGEGLFDISQIKAKSVIIQIFSMYCPLCQREASRVNELYENIEKDPNTRGKLKLIGIGAGNSQFEVDIFLKTYEVPFPLFPDGDYSIHKSLGEVRTPYFIGVKINDDGSHEIYYSKVGGFEKAEEFLQLMLRLSGLK